MDKMRINVLIIDDDSISLEQSRQKLSVYVEAEKIYTAGNVVEVMGILQSIPMDLVFIDVEMPDADGFAIADYLASTQPKARYVFLTGHTEMGAKSYDYDPLDFLCKPVSVLRLGKTFERFKKSKTAGRNPGEQIAIESMSGFVLISPSDIWYITRENRKTIIYCQKESYVVKSSLDELELMFSDFDLFRCHQSYLVSLPRVTGVTQASFGRTYWAGLEDGRRVPVSRGKYAALRERLKAGGTCFL